MSPLEGKTNNWSSVGQLFLRRITLGVLGISGSNGESSGPDLLGPDRWVRGDVISSFVRPVQYLSNIKSFTHLPNAPVMSQSAHISLRS